MATGSNKICEGDRMIFGRSSYVVSLWHGCYCDTFLQWPISSMLRTAPSEHADASVVFVYKEQRVMSKFYSSLRMLRTLSLAASLAAFAVCASAADKRAADKGA